MVIPVSALAAVFVLGPVLSTPQDDPSRRDDGGSQSRRAREEAAYRVTRCVIPSDVELEIGGLAVVQDPVPDRVIAVTRRGEVWAIDGFAGAAPRESAAFTLVAEGLHEPLGLVHAPGGPGLVTACRAELSRLEDEDGDGVFESIATIADDWHISGNYHEYNFGPAIALDGSYWITTNKPFGDQPFGKVDWRGYAFRIRPDGEVKPMCAGLRSPAGIESSPWGEIFYTDNQGEWCGAGKLSLLVPGGYYGHPHGIESTTDPNWTFAKPKALPEGVTYAEIAASGEYPAFRMPAVWFPYDKVGRSPAGFAWDTTRGKFGPFEDQVFVADQYEAAVFRVCLERVGGHWQGACFRFRDGLGSGAVRLAWTRGGALLVGETHRGWGSKGVLSQGLERIDWTGVIPFEIRTMRVLQDGKGPGFELRFTHSVDQASLTDLAGYSAMSYTYEASERYGSDELDRREHEIVGVRAHEDGRGVDVILDGLRAGYVHELSAHGVRRSADPSAAAAELGLLHEVGYYTVVVVP